MWNMIDFSCFSRDQDIDRKVISAGIFDHVSLLFRLLDPASVLLWLLGIPLPSVRAMPSLLSAAIFHSVRHSHLP